MILLSVRAGLRAGEIAKLTWSMVLDADRRIADRIELHDSAAKKGSGRTIPLRRDLRRALQQLRRHNGAEGAVIYSERGGSRGMRPGSVVNWFRGLYRELGLNGCSSHSGRRTFITNAASRRQPAGCAAVGWSSLDRANPTLHRRQRQGEAAAYRIDVATPTAAPSHRRVAALSSEVGGLKQFLAFSVRSEVTDGAGLRI
jgi:integrase